MMAGLSKTGFRPFFFVYSTFLQRAFDQAFQEVSLQGLAVRLCLDRAGLVGGDGAVHHGFCDISLLKTLPGAALTAAIDEPSLLAAFEFMRTYDDGLSVVRYPRDTVSPRLIEQECPAFVLGKSRLLTPATDASPDVAIVAFGTPAIDALKAADELAAEGYTVAVYDARFAKPIDRDMIRTLCENKTPVVTVEDHGVVGGFGACYLEAAADMHLDASRTIRLAIPDSWIMQDSRAKQLAECGLDAPGIARAARQAVEQFGSKDKAPRVQVRSATSVIGA
jgi:1-deoxy-D-xylulose-5-phosphate synthase